MRKESLAMLAAVATLLLGGCPSFWNSPVTAEKPSTPDEMFKEAEEKFQNKDYSRAVELYERIRATNPPDFKKIPEVNLKIAEALFNQGSYDAATARYYQFLELYPNHKEVPRARYQIAMTHFKQIKGLDLDIRALKQAAESFKRLIDDPNAGEWLSKAEEKYNECQIKLAERALYEADTNKRSGRYGAARMAAQRVVDEFPKTPQAQEAKDFLKSIKGK